MMHGTDTKVQPAEEAALLHEFCSAVAQDLTMLTLLHDAEPDESLLQAVKEVGFPGNLGLNLDSEPGREAASLMQEALDALPDPPDQATLDGLAADYADIYLTHGLRASPYESVWLDEDHLERQEAMFQVREYYQRHGLATANWRNRTEDHLVLQLQFLAHLCDAEKPDEVLSEAACFMDEHLLRWLMSFAQRVASRASTPFFAGVALVTAAYCEELRDLLARILDQPRPSPEEVEQRCKPRPQAPPVPEKYIPGIGPSW